MKRWVGFHLQEVIFSVYVVEPGRSSEALIAALAAAARRGVQLRLRTDGFALELAERLAVAKASVSLSQFAGPGLQRLELLHASL